MSVASVIDVMVCLAAQPHGNHYDYIPGHYHYHEGHHYNGW
jgi:hypothetical protein